MFDLYFAEWERFWLAESQNHCCSNCCLLLLIFLEAVVLPTNQPLRVSSSWRPLNPLKLCMEAALVGENACYPESVRQVEMQIGSLQQNSRRVQVTGVSLLEALSLLITLKYIWLIPWESRRPSIGIWLHSHVVLMQCHPALKISSYWM